MTDERPFFGATQPFALLAADALLRIIQFGHNLNKAQAAHDLENRGFVGSTKIGAGVYEPLSPSLVTLSGSGSGDLPSKLTLRTHPKPQSALDLSWAEFLIRTEKIAQRIAADQLLKDISESIATAPKAPAEEKARDSGAQMTDDEWTEAAILAFKEVCETSLSSPRAHVDEVRKLLRGAGSSNDI